MIDALSYGGVTHIDMPASPLEVWQTIQDTRGRGSEAGMRDANPSGHPPHSGGPDTDV